MKKRNEKNELKIQVSLTELQYKHLESIEWLLGDSRADGKSTLLAFVFLKKAILNPGTRIKVFDHNPHVHSTRYLLGLIERMVPIALKKYFKVHVTDFSIEFSL